MKKTVLLAALLTLSVAPGCRSKADSPVTSAELKPSVPKPSDFHMASRMTVRWKVAETEALRTLPVEEFAWGGQTNAISLATLRPLVTFASSAPDGASYTLTEEDLKLLELTDLRYEEGALGADHLTFKVRYNGIAGSDKLSLSLSRYDYFRQKFEVDPAFAPQYYLGGVAQNFGVYSGSILKAYDREKYALVLSVDQVSASSNTLRVKAVVHLPRYRKEDVQTLTFDVTGFKSLQTLGDNLILATSSELNDAIRTRLQRLRDRSDAAILANLRQSLRNWLQLAQVGVRTDNGSLGILSWERDGRRLVGNRNGGVDTRDVYLDEVHFELLSARLSEDRNTLELGLKFTGANEQALDGKTLSLTVRSLHL